jgi:hypothetical protein
LLPRGQRRFTALRFTVLPRRMHAEEIDQHDDPVERSSEKLPCRSPTTLRTIPKAKGSMTMPARS